MEENKTLENQTPEPVVLPETPEDTPVNSVVEQKKKPWVKIVILLIVILLVCTGLVFAGMEIQKRQAATLPTPSLVAIATPTPDPTASWKTYISAKYGYSIKYPNNVTYQESDFLGVKGKTETTIILQIDKGSLEIAANVGGRGIAPIKTQNITIGGVKTDKFYETETTGIIKAIPSPKGEDLYFSFFLPGDPVKSKEIDTLIDQILSTFEFIN